MSLEREDVTTVEQLIDGCIRAMDAAYAPHSNVHVGAALLCDDGTVFTGCNVENSSYGLTICAERTAVVKAVSEGRTKFKAIAVAYNLPGYASPCGACRQFLVEFGTDWDVYMVGKDRTFVKKKTGELLPGAFTPANLQGALKR
ncbi:cytidine deaminase-like [Ornithodoros turicata]|uniref:cytidine deaminase-like n=1 Tax=Ornithodoros turicata TaxID=34597 RepID=UPI003139B8E5